MVAYHQDLNRAFCMWATVYKDSAACEFVQSGEAKAIVTGMDLWMSDSLVSFGQQETDFE